MGNYTSGTDVYQLLLDLKIGPPARFTAADAESLVEGIEAEIDSMLLGQGYAIPATGDRNIAMLGQMARRKVAAMVYDHLFQPDRSPDWVRTAHIDYSDFLKAIRDGQRRLFDQSTDVAQDRGVKIVRMRKLPYIPKDID